MTVICNHSSYNFRSVQQCTEGGTQAVTMVLLFFLFFNRVYLFSRPDLEYFNLIKHIINWCYADGVL